MNGGFQSPRAPLLLSIYASLVYAFLYFPIVVLVVYSFNGSGVGGFPPAHWTLDWYRQLFGDGALWEAVWNSVIVAVVAVTITLGHGTALISVATTEIFAGLQKLERAQEEASLDLGANHWRTFWRVTLPNLRGSLIAAALLIFTLSLDEIAVTFFLIGRDNTLPLEIWSRLRRGMTPEINAISTLMLLFSILTILIWYRLRTRSQRGSEKVAAVLATAGTGEPA